VTPVPEGWGLAVTEAAAMGTPSIAYDVPGLRDSVRESGGVLTDADPTTLGALPADRLPRLMNK
jgi:glycosyltransferase involved in cell wall biosynthesis